MKLYWFLILLIFLSSSNGDNLISLKSVKGSCQIKNNSLDQAYKCAFSEACKTALQKANIPIEVTNASILKSNSNDGNVTSSYQSVFTESKAGAIIKIDSIDQRILGNKLSLDLYNVVVKKYSTSKDDSYRLKIEGIKQEYIENQNLDFLLSTTYDSYINIVMISNDEVYTIYPNEIEPSGALEAGKTYQFPINSDVEYKLTKDSNEFSELIVLATKERFVLPSEIDRMALQLILNNIEPSIKVWHKQIMSIR